MGKWSLCRGSGRVETTLSSLAPVPRVGKERGGAVCGKRVREPINNLGKDAVPGQKGGERNAQVEEVAHDGQKDGEQKSVVLKAKQKGKQGP